MSRTPIHRLFGLWLRAITIIRSQFWSFMVGARRLTVYGPVAIHHAENIIMGDDCTLNHWCVLNARAPLIIGQRVRISAGSMITTAGLETQVPPGERRRHESEKITIGDDVWIGAGAVVLPGITIGPRTVVGAGAVVTRDLPADVVAVGIPARPVTKNT